MASGLEAVRSRAVGATAGLAGAWRAGTGWPSIITGAPVAGQSGQSRPRYRLPWGGGRSPQPRAHDSRKPCMHAEMRRAP
eukprot:11174702-Lingulodinium_polyedra.AAC.1